MCIRDSFEITEGGDRSIIYGIRTKDLEISSASDIFLNGIFADRALVDNSTNVTLRNIFISGNNSKYFSSVPGIWNTVTIKLLIRDSPNANIINSIIRGQTSIVHQSVAGVRSENIVCENSYFESRITNVNYRNNIHQTSKSNFRASGDLGGNFEPASSIIQGTSYNGHTNSFDSQFRLRPDAAAAGTATDGGDPGPFGGPDPYRLSGIPEIPIIYGLDADQFGTTGGGLNVNIRVRAN